MIEIRAFTVADAEETAEMIASTLRISNRNDYSEQFIENSVRSHSAEALLKQAQEGHFFVASSQGRIVGCGGIIGYWGSLTESYIMNCFVLPQYQGRGIGRRIMNRIETDEIFLRAKRTELAASVTACDFYRKLGYTFKNGRTNPDAFGCIRLEKFRENI